MYIDHASNLLYNNIFTWNSYLPVQDCMSQYFWTGHQKDVQFAAGLKIMTTIRFLFATGIPFRKFTYY